MFFVVEHNTILHEKCKKINIFSKKTDLKNVKQNGLSLCSIRRLILPLAYTYIKNGTSVCPHYCFLGAILISILGA